MKPMHAGAAAEPAIAPEAESTAAAPCMLASADMAALADMAAAMRDVSVLAIVAAIIAEAWPTAPSAPQQRMAPMATTATGAAATTTNSAKRSVRNNIRIGIDATELRGGGLLPPSRQSRQRRRFPTFGLVTSIVPSDRMPAICAAPSMHGDRKSRCRDLLI
jgi:hypothetical protein